MLVEKDHAGWVKITLSARVKVSNLRWGQPIIAAVFNGNRR